MILITAANGNQGKWLVPKLLAAGHNLRACVQSQTSAEQLRALGVADVVVGDLADPYFIIQAMRDIRSVYHVGPTLHPAERTIGFNMNNAAAAAGVDHFVFSSVLHAITTDLIQHEIKRDLEEHLLSSGLEFTILQPSNYMLPHRMKPVFEEGVFRLSWSLERRQSMVALKDVADVVLEVLSYPERHVGATYELVGPGRFTGHDIGRTLSAVFGREIRVEQIAPSAFVKSMFVDQDSQTSAYKAKAAGAISARYSSHDFVGNPNVLTWILGRPPTTFAEFAQEEYRTHDALHNPV
jgi:uncharacterized protein YbjT (DUF2867 family)